MIPMAKPLPQGRLYAASRDGTIRIFNLETDNAKRICASTGTVIHEEAGFCHPNGRGVVKGRFGLFRPQCGQR
jgi:hypothetical protein